MRKQGLSPHFPEDDNITYCSLIIYKYWHWIKPEMEYLPQLRDQTWIDKDKIANTSTTFTKGG
jgi:hypothetical protein